MGITDEVPGIVEEGAGLDGLVETAGNYFITDDEAGAMLKTAQSVLADPDAVPPARAAARKVLNALARNPSTPASILHGAVVFHDGHRERERDWREGDGHEDTTRLVVHNPSVATRTLEVIAGTDGGHVRYEAWKQLKVRSAAESNSPPGTAE